MAHTTTSTSNTNNNKKKKNIAKDSKFNVLKFGKVDGFGLFGG
jgi:hypothetical protein